MSLDLGARYVLDAISVTVSGRVCGGSVFDLYVDGVQVLSDAGGFGFQKVVPFAEATGRHLTYVAKKFAPACGHWFEVSEVQISVVRAASVPVTIDVKPGSDPNSVNPRAKGRLPVAVLGTSSFDPSTIDAATVRLGPTGTEAAPAHAVLEDVDGDGAEDLVLHFPMPGTGIACGDESVVLTGLTHAGDEIEGSDAIRTTGCR